MPSTEHTTPTMTKHRNEKPKTSMKMSNPPRGSETEKTEARTPRCCPQEGNDCRKPSPFDPEDQVFTRNDTKTMGAPRRSLQEGERHPRTPPPSASTGTGRVMNPSAPTPPSQSHSTNHPHPCRPSDHGCPPAPEPRGQPTTNAPPAARATGLPADRPDDHQRPRL